MATDSMLEPEAAAAAAGGASAARQRPSKQASRSTRALFPTAYNGQKWARFLDRCLATRLSVDRFTQFAPLQQRKYPVAPALLADLLLRPRSGGVGSSTTSATATATATCDAFIDPRIPAYLQVLLQLRHVDVTSVLQALYRYSTSQRAAQKSAHVKGEQQQQQGDRDGDDDDASGPLTPAVKIEPGSRTGGGPSTQTSVGRTALWGNSYANEETTFYRITRAVRQGTAIRNHREALAIARSMAAWMDLFVAAAAETTVGTVVGTGARDLTAQEHMQEEMGAARAAFVMLLLAVFENEILCAALAIPAVNGARKLLSASIGSFVPVISLTPTPITARLEQFRADTLGSLEPADKKEAEAADLHDIINSTVELQNLVLPEMPTANSRAGLYIYLNACLVGRPLIDDTALFTYLHNRYQGDLQTTAIDLILASFDVLANAVFRTEVHTSAHLLRSFLLNKVPLLLASLASSPLYPFNAEYCISEALSRVDTNAFPTMSSMFDDNQNTTPLTDSARQDFCFACCLHGLIAETSIETLLGEMTYQTLPDGGRFTKERLVQQCLGGGGGGGDAGRITALVGQLDSMDGNAGAACQALVAVLGQLCERRETATLKGLCNQLVRKPLAFDVVLLFEKLSAVVWPLCRLLDTWRYDDDQGEYQPVYEEFGAVLFLLLAFVHRYGLSVADLGIEWPADSFVARLLTKGHLGRTLAEISEQEGENLGNWIRGLFDTDAGGLSDDLMSSCPPQQFYMLTPTLFQQIVQAVSTNALSEEMLKCGIEYLVDTFLLPSLVTALIYLSDMLRVERLTEQRAILRVLHLILQPATISSEAATMLSALLNVVAKPLEQALRTYQRQDPKSQEVDPLLRVLKPNIPRSRRTAAAEHNELTFGNTSNNGGLAAAVRQTVQSFVQWSVHPGVNTMPTWYTHRQFLAALRLMGAPRLLQLILDDLQRQVEAGSGSMAYDVACALVCAPDVTNEPSPAMLYVLGGEGGDRGSDKQQKNDLVPNPATVQRRMSLRQALAFRAEEWKQMQRSGRPSEMVMAETIVRLHRRVEAQMAPPPPAAVAAAAAAAVEMVDMTDLGGDLGGNLGGDLGADLTSHNLGGLDGTDVAAAAAAALDGAAMDSIAAAAVQAAAADAADAADAMTLDTTAPPASSKTAAGAAVTDLDDLGDLGDLGSLEGLGDMDGLGDIGGASAAGSLDLGDQSMFSDLELISWIDMQ